MRPPLSLISELRSRHVFQVAAWYAAAAWLIIQIADTVIPNFGLPAWTIRVVIVAAVAGLPIAILLAWAFDLSRSGFHRTLTTAAPAEAGEARSLLSLVLAVAAGALLGAAAITGWHAFEAPADTPGIAVLPFVNLSSDPEQDYFSDGLSEELLNQLAQVAGLRVTGRTSAFVFKDHSEDLRTIGEKLGVAYILEGSVSKSGNRLRIRARLVNAADGYDLWSESFDRKLDDVFAIQESVARAVTTALGVTLGVSATERLVGGTTNLEAYDKYLRARALFYQSGLPELLRSVEIYREALALDPQFALAWYGLYTALGDSLVMDPRGSDPARKEMETVGARMVALAPDAWWTHAMRSGQALLQHRWSDAEAAASAALAAAPTSEVGALVTYATFLMYVGRIDEAVDIFQRARQADPLSLRVSGFLQLFFDIAGRREEAQAEFERSKDLAGGHARWEWAAMLRLWARDRVDPAAVEAHFRSYLEQEKDVPRNFNHELVDLLDQPLAARGAIRRIFDDPAANQHAAAMTLVFLYADLLGDKDLALTALRRAFVDLNKVNFEGLWWPFVTGLRTDPRFKDIVRDIGLVDYWRASGNWGDFARPRGGEDFEIIR